MKPSVPYKKIDLVEVKKEMNKIWKKKEENDVKNESMSNSGVDISSEN